MNIILEGKEKNNLCKELKIKYDAPKILIKVVNNKASYYNIEKDSYIDIDLKIVSKYI